MRNDHPAPPPCGAEDTRGYGASPMQNGGANDADVISSAAKCGAAKKMRALSERQENFCQAYLVAGNATKAAINAGYSERGARQQGSRLLTNANILERIAGLRADLGLRNRIDRDTVMAKLEAAYRGAMTAHTYLTAVRAAEAQARLAGLFPDRAVAGRAAPRDGAGRSPQDGNSPGRNGGRTSSPRKIKGNGASAVLARPEIAR